jgi:hypothetical protein
MRRRWPSWTPSSACWQPVVDVHCVLWLFSRRRSCERHRVEPVQQLAVGVGQHLCRAAPPLSRTRSGDGCMWWRAPQAVTFSCACPPYSVTRPLTRSRSPSAGMYAAAPLAGGGVSSGRRCAAAHVSVSVVFSLMSEHAAYPRPSRVRSTACTWRIRCRRRLRESASSVHASSVRARRPRVPRRAPAKRVNLRVVLTSTT